MQSGSSVGIYIACKFFARLAPSCMLSWCLLTKFLHRSSVGSTSRVRCWLGTYISAEDEKFFLPLTFASSPHYFFFWRGIKQEVVTSSAGERWRANWRTEKSLQHPVTTFTFSVWKKRDFFSKTQCTIFVGGKKSFLLLCGPSKSRHLLVLLLLLLRFLFLPVIITQSIKDRGQWFQFSLHP